jgi:hypothetical protein
MFEVVGLFIAAPFAALADWLKFVRHLPPREQNLARASHGAALLIFAALALRVIGFVTFLHMLVAGPAEPMLWLPALLWCATVAWGAVWFTIGCRRSGGPRDGLLISRAAAKSVTGLTALFIAWAGLVPGDWWGAGFIVIALYLAGIWCVVTGLVKLVLLTRGSRTNAAGIVARQIARTAIFWRAGRPRKF